MEYSIKVYKQYFNFAASHFLIFKDGSREPLHGHNYRVQVKGENTKLEADMVFDFLDIKPIVREVCDSLDHKLLLPGENPQLNISTQKKNYFIQCPDGDEFSIPKKDVLILPIPNTSAERLAVYMAHEIKTLLKARFNFSFKQMEIEVEETPGQCAVYSYKE
jgi:6-pyruvoyltetrahydropterin/6-carboxytetrahydropterin synthase